MSKYEVTGRIAGHEQGEVLSFEGDLPRAYHGRVRRIPDGARPDHAEGGQVEDLLREAKQKCEALTAEAQKQAADIVEEAKKQAQDIVAQAEQTALDMVKAKK